MSPPAAELPRDLAAEHLGLRSTILHALQSGEPVVARVRGRGFSPDLLRLFARCETRSLAVPDLNPGQSPQEQERQFEAVDVRAVTVGRKRADILRLLAETAGRDMTERLSLAEIRRADGFRRVIRLHVRQDLPADAPVLMFDADAVPAIVRHFVPHAGFFRIDTRREAGVVQAQDLTLSNAWLLNHEKARAHRATVARILRSEVTRAGWGNLLVVTNRDVLRQLHHDAGTPFERDDASLRQSLHGAEPRRPTDVPSRRRFAGSAVIGLLPLSRRRQEGRCRR